MKHLLFIVSLFILDRASAQLPFDVLHYKFELAVTDRSDTINGKATITVVRHNKNVPLEIDLISIDQNKIDLSAANLRKGMRVAEVRVANNIIRNFRHEKDKITIPLTEAGSGDTLSVVITYAGIPADGLIISKNKYGQRTFFADNWPNRAHNWIPCIDNPADKASVEFIVTAPNHYQVISNGLQLEETNLTEGRKLTHWKESVPLPTKVMVVGIASFAVQQAGFADCVPVYSWVYPEDKTAGFYDYAQAAEILRYYVDYIGPFPYGKLANVQSKTIFGGMENAGAIFYYENSVTGKRAEEGLLAHEIVHQWFGDMATEKSFAHLWLSEGFATYLTHVYMQSMHGDEVFRARMRNDRVKILEFVRSESKPVVDSASALMDLLNANSYEKGSWFLHMLRNKIGDSLFRKVIRNYYDAYKGRNADTDDFRHIAETVSGKDLKQFFGQWLFTPVNPDLDISWSYDAPAKKLIFKVKQLQEPLFDIPLSVVVTADGKKQPFSFNIKKKEEEFAVALSSKPEAMVIDPDVLLLAKFVLRN